MLQSLFYFAFVLLVGAAAAGDWLSLLRARKPGAEAVPGRPFREARLWFALWAGFQGAAVLALLAAGMLGRLGPYVGYYALLTVLLPGALIAGADQARRAGTPGFVLTRRLLARRRGEGAQSGPAGVRPVLRAAAELAALAGGALAATAALLWFFSWRPDPRLAEALGSSPPAGGSGLLLLAYIFVSAALAEEFLFRHYLLNRLLGPGGTPAAGEEGRSGAWRSMFSCLAAVLLVTAVWGLGHGGMVQPAWIKYVQIGFYGLALGATQIRHGTEGSIGVHLILNAATPFLAGWLTPAAGS